MRRPRHLSPDERVLWEFVARRTNPLHKERPVPAPTPALPSKPAPARISEPSVTRRFRVGEVVDHNRSDDLLPGLAEQMGRAPVRMNAKAFGRLKRGKLIPEGRIDLHGMTMAAAHPALTGFILSSQSAGKRLVLVITGKGRVRDEIAPMPAREGVLRHQVPHWLALPPLSQAVLQVAPAHQRHGGAGAYYVYLRKTR